MNWFKPYQSTIGAVIFSVLITLAIYPFYHLMFTASRKFEAETELINKEVENYDKQTFYPPCEDTD